MEKKANEDISFRVQEALLHPSKNADIACEYAKWMGEDLAHVPGVGDWNCILTEHKEILDQYGTPAIEYYPCEYQNHEKCPIYLKEKEKQTAKRKNNLK